MEGGTEWERPAVFNALVSGGIMTGSAEVHEMASGTTRRAEAMPLLCAISILGGRARGGGGGGGGGGVEWRGSRWKINGVISRRRRKVGLNPGKRGFGMGEGHRPS